MRHPIASALPILGVVLAMSACSKPAPPPDVVVAPPAAAPAPPPPAAPAADEVPVYDYSAQDGDWHTNYRKWQPSVVFELGGHYYPHEVAGARSVQVYHYQNRYFMPPRDAKLTVTDKRIDPKRLPSDDDYHRARPRPQL